MSARYAVRPQADRDLDAYADYLAEEASLDVALRFFDAAHSTFARIAAQPDMGWRSRIKHPGLESLRVFRVTGFESMLVFYRPLAGGVEVLRVVHGSRDLRAMLRRQGIE